MNILTYHRHQYHPALAVKANLEDKGEQVELIELEAQGTEEQLVNLIQSYTKDEDTVLYLLQKEDHAFFYNSKELKAVYYTWTDRTRLRWVQPSHFTTPLPW
jgi:hypothetical protein